MPRLRASRPLLLGVAFLLIVYLIPHGVVGLIEDQTRHRDASIDGCARAAQRGKSAMPDAAPATVALTANAVSKRFGGLVAVDEMSFELRENEVLGLIGPNGSGKTTMINLISGALRPTAAQIRLYEQDDLRGHAGRRSRARASRAPSRSCACCRP